MAINYTSCKHKTDLTERLDGTMTSLLAEAALMDPEEENHPFHFLFSLKDAEACPDVSQTPPYNRETIHQMMLKRFVDEMASTTDDTTVGHIITNVLYGELLNNCGTGLDVGNLIDEVLARAATLERTNFKPDYYNGYKRDILRGQISVSRRRSNCTSR